ncbi:hypothetical protein CG719_32960 [Streptomyces sp. CB01373]|nr:hypothetical protein CG719_32960 [Streptomyces sp. CB01373]
MALAFYRAGTALPVSQDFVESIVDAGLTCSGSVRYYAVMGRGSAQSDRTSVIAMRRAKASRSGRAAYSRPSSLVKATSRTSAALGFTRQ